MDAQQVPLWISEKLTDWGESLIKMLPNLAVALVIIVAFGLASRLAGNLTNRGLTRISDNSAINNLLSTTARLLIVAIGVFFALGVLELDKTVTSLLASVGVIGLALSFAFKDIAANFMSGVLLAIRKPFKVGDLVETNDFFGKVERIELRTIRLRRLTGQVVTIPNRLVLENPFENYDEPAERRVDLDVGISYGDELPKVRDVTLEAVGRVPGRTPDRDVELFFTGFGDSSINFVVRFWIQSTSQPAFLKARSDAIMNIKRAYDENDITIPFPIRTLDFGIVGGQRLNEVLPDVSIRQGAAGGNGQSSPRSHGSSRNPST